MPAAPKVLYLNSLQHAPRAFCVTQNPQTLDVKGRVQRQTTGLTARQAPVYARKVMNLGGLQNIPRLPDWDYVSKST